MLYEGESSVSAVLVLKEECPIQYLIGEGNVLKLLDNKYNLVRTIEGHKGKIVSISYRSSRVYSADCVGVCNVWDIRDNFKWIQTVKRQSSLSTFALSHDGSRFVGGLNRGGLHNSLLDVWDADTLLYQYAYPGIDSRGVYSSTFFHRHAAIGVHDPNTVVVGGYGAVHIFDTTEQMHVTSFAAHTGPVNSLALWYNCSSGNSNSSRSGNVYGISAMDAECEWSRDHVCLLVTGGEDKQILLWDAVDFTAEKFLRTPGAQPRRFCGHQSAVTHLQTACVRQYALAMGVLCSGSRDRTIRVWCLASGTQLCLFDQCNAAVSALHLCTLVVPSPIKPTTVTLTPPTHAAVWMTACWGAGLMTTLDLSAELVFLRRRTFLQFLCGYDLLPLSDPEIYAAGEMEVAASLGPTADGLDDLSAMMAQMYRQNNVDGPICACLSINDLCRCISAYL